jgi:hypothetical protein
MRRSESIWVFNRMDTTVTKKVVGVFVRFRAPLHCRCYFADAAAAKCCDLQAARRNSDQLLVVLQKR